MTSGKIFPLLAALLVAGAILAVIDLQRIEQRSLVLYTTPALKEALEKDILPRFKAETGVDVVPMYLPAGQQYNRLRLSGDDPEADIFLHASPLYVEKGFDNGYFVPQTLPQGANLSEPYKSEPVPGGRIWTAFAWTPLVEVYTTSIRETPDLATADVTFGLAHPLLSNNGVYNAVFYEAASPEAGTRALARTTVQPTNARASINGVADGGYDVTLGYEAATLFYRAQGARVNYDLPLLDGERYLVPVVFSVGVVNGENSEAARAFVQFLLSNETQRNLPRYHLRPTLDANATPPGGVAIPEEDVEVIRTDWSNWERIETALPRYEVTA